MNVKQCAYACVLEQCCQPRVSDSNSKETIKKRHRQEIRSLIIFVANLTTAKALAALLVA